MLAAALLMSTASGADPAAAPSPAPSPSGSASAAPAAPPSAASAAPPATPAGVPSAASATLAAVPPQPTVTPSSCPSGPAPLAYGTQPTLAVTATGPTRFEVWAEGGPDRTDAPLVTATADGPGPRVTWQVPPGVLQRGATYAWRAGPPNGPWSDLRALTVNTDLPEVAECRLDGQALLGLSFRAADAGIGLAEAVEDYGWQDPFASLAVELAREFAADFAAWGLDDSDPRRGWLGFRAEMPAAAAERVEELQSTWPAATVDVRPGRGYTDLELSKRMYAALGAVLRQFDKVLDADASAAGATGVITLTVQRHPDATGSDAELAAALRRAVQAETELSVVPATDGAVATATVQPVDVVFAHR